MNFLASERLSVSQERPYHEHRSVLGEDDISDQNPALFCSMEVFSNCKLCCPSFSGDPSAGLSLLVRNFPHKQMAFRTDQINNGQQPEGVSSRP